MNYRDLKPEQLRRIHTLGELRAAGYQPRTIKKELRENLIVRMRRKEAVFPGIYGYEDTVIPDLERAILSMHNVNLLGLRGQAKTRLARMMIGLLDPLVPVIAGTELNDDPLQPLSRQGRDQLKEHGDDTPVGWLAREARYNEKLATPDVSVADLIGDVDPIKAATLKLPYSDERTIHYGLIPRSNRCIFVINELPDLQARIQVALFNILQEGDIQIRGFNLRLPLDIQFVFTANPEDYTNRGSIVTPLKDRIESQITTHYPKSIEIGKQITRQEAHVKPEQERTIGVQELIRDLNEQLAFEARENEYVDANSGVSARLTISAFENLLSAAERRSLRNGDKETHVRIADFAGVVPAITGKIELVYEGEQEGPLIVAQNLIGKAIRTQFTQYFPDPEKAKKKRDKNPYKQIIDWFGEGQTVDIMNDAGNQEYEKALRGVPGLEAVVKAHTKPADRPALLLMMEFALHGLAEYSVLSKNRLERGLQFKDLLSSMFSFGDGDDDGDDDDA
ncbi:MAG: magnesium chelatase [Catalinimonas sp.]